MEIKYNETLLQQIEANKKYLSSKDIKIITDVTSNTDLNKNKTDSSTEIKVKSTDLNKNEKNVNINTIDNIDLTKQKSAESASLSIDDPTLNKETANVNITPSLNGINYNNLLDNIDTITSPLSTGINLIDGIAENTASQIQGIYNSIKTGLNNFNNSDQSIADITNSELISVKTDVKKTIDMTTSNTTSYVVDDYLKSFQQGDTVNSIISGVISTIDSIAGLSETFYDTTELIQLAQANFNQINNNGNLFGSDGLFGVNAKVGGGKPEIKIKTPTADGYKTFDGSVPEYSGSDFRNKIGNLYVRPFYNNLSIKPFNIPFQMNVKINEDSIQANYASEQLLNRVGELKSFINTSGLNITLETNYVILSDTSENHIDDSAIIENDVYLYNSSKGNNSTYSDWMNDWTPQYVKAIENAYRSLVFSTYYTMNAGTNNSYTGILKPPTIRIVMNRDSEIKDIYTYPNRKYSLETKTSITTNDTTSYLTNLHNTDKNNKNSNYNWNKCFIATGVNISTEEDTGINWNSNSVFYTGFKVTLNLTEVTENYLDCIPDFRAYYESYVGTIGEL